MPERHSPIGVAVSSEVSLISYLMNKVLLTSLFVFEWMISLIIEVECIGIYDMRECRI